MRVVAQNRNHYTRVAMWWVYRITCETSNHFYIGITQNPAHRFRQHAKRLGSAFTKRHGYLYPEIVTITHSEKVAKMAEKLAVKRLGRSGNVVCGSGWSWERG